MNYELTIFLLLMTGLGAIAWSVRTSTRQSPTCFTTAASPPAKQGRAVADA